MLVVLGPSLFCGAIDMNAYVSGLDPATTLHIMLNSINGSTDVLGTNLMQQLLTLKVLYQKSYAKPITLTQTFS